MAEPGSSEKTTVASAGEDGSVAPAPLDAGAAPEQRDAAHAIAAPLRPLGRWSAGFALLFEGFGVLRRERALWSLALAPLGFSLVGVSLALVALYTNAGDLLSWIEAALPVLEVGAWYQWLWLGPARLVLWILGYLLFALAAGLALVLSVLLATVAAAPFLDALSERTERLLTGAVEQSGESGAGAVVRDIGRSILNDARRLAFFLAISLVLFGVGLLIPGAALVTGPAMFAVTLLFLPLDYAAYALDRRQISFRARRRWLVAELPRMLGFGAAAFLACFVPGANLLMIPVLVVGGTLLVLRHPPKPG